MRFPSSSMLLISLVYSAGVSAGVVAIDAPIIPPSEIYHVQIGALPDQAEASSLKDTVSRSGYAPIDIQNSTPYYKVIVGQFDNYPDAHELKDDLKADGYDGFIVTQKNNDQSQAVLTQLKGKNNRLGIAQLKLKTDSSAPPVSSILSEGIPAAEDMDKVSTQALSELLKPIIDSRQAGDPVKGYCLYYYALSSEKSRNKNDVNMAMNSMREISLGKINAPDGFQLMATLQLADIVHYTEKDYSQAYRIYKLLLQCGALSPKQTAQIQAELAGTLLEMMDSGNKGNPSEVRHELQELYAQMSDEYRKEKATVELIYSETYFWEKKSGGLESALEYAKSIQSKYSDVPAVLTQAMWNEATAQERLGNPAEARSVLLNAVSVYIPENEQFRSRLTPFDMEKRISHFLSRLSKDLGKSKESLTWKQNESSIQATTASLQMRIPGL